jgi:hypothetical protein
MQITKCEIIISVCILEGTYSRGSGIRGYFPQLVNYQYFWRISSKDYVILCFIDTSKLRRTAATVRCVRNTPVHSGHDQSVKCVLTEFIASANLFGINVVH